VWKAQLALLLVVVATPTVSVIPLKTQSRSALAEGRRRGVAAMAVLLFALLVRYLSYPDNLNHAEANVAAVSWLGWEGYPLHCFEEQIRTRLPSALRRSLFGLLGAVYPMLDWAPRPATGEDHV
jgi:hypothetical protein